MTVDALIADDGNHTISETGKKYPDHPGDYASKAAQKKWVDAWDASLAQDGLAHYVTGKTPRELIKLGSWPLSDIPEAANELVK